MEEKQKEKEPQVVEFRKTRAKVNVLRAYLGGEKKLHLRVKLWMAKVLSSHK